MTRDEAAAALEGLIEDLRGDARRAQTRDLAIALGRRIADAEALLAGMRAA